MNKYFSDLFSKIARKKFFILAFFTGFSMMVMELIASRILAPIVGTSVYTWTSVISIILLGMVFGNFIGGILIDKKNDPQILQTLYYLASLSILTIPVISKLIPPVILLEKPLLVIILAATASLFMLPSILIGAIYPCIFKLEILHFSTIGLESGKLSGIWSLGSIIGTFLTGFYFIDQVGSTNTLFVTAGILFACGFLIGKNRYSTLFLFLPPLFYTLTQSAINFSNANVLYEDESQYYKIRVVEKKQPNASVQYLFLDMDTHSIESSGATINTYVNIPPVFSLIKNEIRSVLVLGGGSLSISAHFKKSYPESEITTIEIDKKVTDVARKFFRKNESFGNTIVADGRIFLATSEKKYDVIFSDAYNSFVSIPPHMATLEFNQIVKSKLSNNGVYAVNFISGLKGEQSYFFQSMLKTFRETFPTHFIFHYGANSDAIQNIVLIGVKDEGYNDVRLQEKLLKKEDLAYFRDKLIERPDLFISESRSPILTDDYAPVEMLMAPVLKSYFPKYAKFFLDNI